VAVNRGVAGIVEALEPGARPVGLRRLKGGLGARMHVLRYEAPSGERRSVVLRRLVRDWDDGTPERARYSFELLGLLAKAGIAAPLPLLLDADGEYFGAPAMVLSYVPGRSFGHQPDEARWVRGLARALAQVHTITPDCYNLTWLHHLPTYVERPYPEIERLDTAGPLAIAAHETLVARADTVAPVEQCLVHDDYWPGNTVWSRGRLVAIVDWTSAGLGDPRTDVAQCRADLVFSNGLDTADAFRSAYQAEAPRPVPDLWYFDLWLGLLALLNYPRWLEGYHDAGMRHLTLADVGRRIRAFVERALEAGRPGGAVV
jgi:aminoglycoside phosphotransferase (APT) family kinase protein